MGRETRRFIVGWLSASALATVLSCIYVGIVAFAFAQLVSGLSGEDAPSDFIQLMAADPIAAVLFVSGFGALIAVLLLCSLLPAAWISQSMPRYAILTFAIAGAVAGAALAPADFVLTGRGAIYFDYVLAMIGALAGLLAGWVFRLPPASRVAPKPATNHQ